MLSNSGAYAGWFDAGDLASDLVDEGSGGSAGAIGHLCGLYEQYAGWRAVSTAAATNSSRTDSDFVYCSGAFAFRRFFIVAAQTEDKPGGSGRSPLRIAVGP